MLPGTALNFREYCSEPPSPFLGCSDAEYESSPRPLSVSPPSSHRFSSGVPAKKPRRNGADFHLDSFLELQMCLAALRRASGTLRFCVRALTLFSPRCPNGRDPRSRPVPCPLSLTSFPPDLPGPILPFFPPLENMGFLLAHANLGILSKHVGFLGALRDPDPRNVTGGVGGDQT